MRNINYTLTIVFALSCFLFSCKKKSPEPEKDPVLALLENTNWSASNVYIDGSQDDQSDYSEVSIKFEGENAYTYTRIGGTEEKGTWALKSEGKVISLKNEDWDIIKLNENELVIEFVEESEKMGEVTIKIEFVKS